MPQNDDNDIAIDDLTRAILSQLKGAGFCFITKKEWREMERHIKSIASQTAMNTVRIQDIHDILNANDQGT